MVGERFGLTGRVVEDEGEEGDFSWGDGEDLASVESLGDAWNSGYLRSNCGDSRDLLTGSGGEGLGEKGYFYWQRKLPDPH